LEAHESGIKLTLGLPIFKLNLHANERRDNIRPHARIAGQLHQVGE
jgi:hypothetical protein